jgi:hypothetical protein
VNKCKNCESVLPDRPLGKAGRNQIYCNQYCGSLFRGELKYVEKPKNCLLCDAALVHVGAGNPKKFCSKQHASKFRSNSKPKVPVVQKSCLVCSTVFETNLKQARYCSPICRTKFVADLHKARRATVVKSYDYECDDCSRHVVSDKLVTRGQHGRYCDFCRLRRRRERYRVKTAKRQKVLNPIRISADVLIERDGNVCHICLDVIDLSLPRNSRFGATIDHVMPVSKGGADTLENMKLAHWICNIKKGAKF